MSNTAAHLVDHVIAPDVTLRQWVLTVPFEFRLLLAAKPDALSAIGRLFIQEIQRWQRQRAQALGFEQAEGAAVSFCQRFGSSLNLNIHWHVIVPDALFLPDATGEYVDTLNHRAPTRLDLEEIVTAVAVRSVGWLDKHGYLRSEGEEDAAENADTDSPWMRCLQGSLGVGELQRWAEHGRSEKKSDRAQGHPLPKPKGLGAEHLKFNLHAGVSVPEGAARRARTLAPLLRSPSPRARAALGARGRHDLRPNQGQRKGASHDADAVYGAHCGVGTSTAPSIGAFLWSVGTPPPLAQQSRDSDSADEAVDLLRPERSASTRGRRPRRRR
jgi:hypothetical protein